MSTDSTSDLYIGLMSGTSLDGVDGVLARCPPDGPPVVLAHADQPFPAGLRDTLLALNAPGPDELDRAAQAAVALADVYADVVNAALKAAGLGASAVRAVGAHGQTVRHRPELGYTLQLNAPARLAEATGIPVVADFRSRDVAAGGQGAPLVPAFHAACFGTDTPRVILNLGGIANVTLLQPDSPVTGFDTGPANLLLDLWCARHAGQPYDAQGAFAASGKVSDTLLAHLVASEPWLALPPPKSTGRDLFHADWLDKRLAAWQVAQGAVDPLLPADVQATLQRLTAQTVADALQGRVASTTEVWVCGGGARNDGLMADLAHCLGRPVQSTDALGIPPQQVEALAFAWLAARHVQGQTANLPAVTGARGERILGAYYPA
ncbi:anhydro-N-acetylmuramic acid kinase [Pigmentiphaga litoralis]|nr:anhydro-N-acetylmuramic acid kinase [Pigmentiphaga litoralis]